MNKESGLNPTPSHQITYNIYFYRVLKTTGVIKDVPKDGNYPKRLCFRFGDRGPQTEHHNNSETESKPVFKNEANSEKDILQKAYKYACASVSQKTYRSRVTFLGHQGVGKTSVVRNILGLPFIEEHLSTHGIDCIDTTCKLSIAHTENWIPVGKERRQISKEQLQQGIINSYKKLKSDENQTKEASAESPIFIESDDEMSTDSDDSSHEDLDDDEERERMPSQIEIAFLPDADVEMLDETMEKVHKNANNKARTKALLQIGIWDFGGQIEYYTTHHLFLDPDSIHILTLDVSKGLDSTVLTEKIGRFGDKEAAIPKTVIEFVHYWLNTIYTYIPDASSVDALPMKVLIVMTHKDKLDPDIREQAINQFITDLFQRIDGKAYERLISPSSIFCVDNKNGDPLEFGRLKKTIIEVAGKRAGWGAARPVRWLQLETSIYKDADVHGRNVVLLDDAYRLASPYNIHGDEFETFIQFHHAMGDILHFSCEALRKYLITVPQWLIDIFACIIRAPHKERELLLSPQLRDLDRKGIVDSALLSRLWSRFEVEPAFLIELMIKFDLLIQHMQDENNNHDSQQALNLVTTHFIVPCMLPVANLSELDGTLNASSMSRITAPLFFKSVGNFIPMGTFQRLVCRCNKLPGWFLHGTMSYNVATFQLAEAPSLLVRLSFRKIAIKVECWEMAGIQPPSYSALGMLPRIKTGVSECLSAISRYLKFSICFHPCGQTCGELSEGCLVETDSIFENLQHTNSQDTFYPPLACPVHIETTLLPKNYAPWLSGMPINGPHQIPFQTEQLLSNISKPIATEGSLRTVGLALGLQNFEVDRIRTDHMMDIQEAGFHLLLFWYTNKWVTNPNYTDEVLSEFIRDVYAECGLCWPFG